MFFDILLNARNPAAHNRHLATHEIELLSGASTYLRNQIALHRSKLEPSSQYYPLIESVVDSFGNTGSDSHHTISGSAPRINVDDTLTFRCSAIDPRGRDLSWGINSTSTILNAGDDVFTVIGEQVSLQYTVVESDVGESFSLSILMRSNGRFRRTGGSVYARDASLDYVHYDDERVFIYAVNPPID